MLQFLRDLSISRKLVLVVTLAFLPVVAANLFTIHKIRNSRQSIDTISAIRLPAHMLLGDIALDVSRSISAFYGFVLTGRYSFAQRRAGNWLSIEQAIAAYDYLHERDPADAQAIRWQGVRNQLMSLKEIQTRHEAARGVGTIDARAMIAMIDQEMVPVARAVMDGLRGNPVDAEALKAGLSGINSEQLAGDVWQVDRNMREIEWMVQGVTLLSLVMLLIGIVVLTRAISRPVVAMAHATKAIAQRDYQTRIPALGSGDEIGRLAAALAEFRDRLAHMDVMESAVRRQHLRESERTESIEKAIEDFQLLADRLIADIAREAHDLRQSADGLMGSAGAVAGEAEQASRLSAKAAVGIRDLAAAGDALTASAQQITVRFAASFDAAFQAVRRVDGGDAQAGQLRQLAGRVGEVVDYVNAIAGRTNLLALNSAIEAARAGEAGHGFAEMANAVRILASDAGQASAQIDRIISEIRAVSEQAAGAMAMLCAALGDVDRSATEIDAVFDEQTRATRAITDNVQRAAEGTEEIARSIAEFSEAASTTAAAASGILGSASGIAAGSERMREEFRRFLDRVRAA